MKFRRRNSQKEDDAQGYSIERSKRGNRSFRAVTINKGGSRCRKYLATLEKHACSGKMSYDRRNRLPF